MRRAAVLVAALVALAGCGSDAGTSAKGTATASSSASSPMAESPSPSPSKDKPSPAADEPAAVPAGTPACGAVWVDGTRLARGYAGCRLGQRFIEPDQESCSFGQR